MLFVERLFMEKIKGNIMKNVLNLLLISIFLIPMIQAYNITIDNQTYVFQDKAIIQVENIKSTNLNYVYADIDLDVNNFDFHNANNCNSFYLQNETNQTAVYKISDCYLKNGEVYKLNLKIYIKEIQTGEKQNYTLYFNSDFDNTNYQYNENLNLSKQDLVFWYSFNDTDSNIQDNSENQFTATGYNLNQDDFNYNAIFNKSIKLIPDKYIEIPLYNTIYTNKDYYNFTLILFTKLTNKDDRQFLFDINDRDFALRIYANQFSIYENGNRHDTGVQVEPYLFEYNEYVLKLFNNSLSFIINNNVVYSININSINFGNENMTINVRKGLNLVNYGYQYIDEFLFYNKSLNQEELDYIYQQSIRYEYEPSFFIYITNFDNGEAQETQTIIKFKILQEENQTNDLTLYDNLIPYKNDYAYIFICNSKIKNEELKGYNYFYELIDELEEMKKNNNGEYKCVFSKYENGEANVNLPIDLINKELDIYFILGTFDIDEFGIPTIQDKKLYKKFGETKLSSGYEYTLILEPEDLYPRWKVFLSTSYKYFSLIVSVLAVIVGIYMTGSILKGSAIGLILAVILKLLGSGITI